MLAELKRDWLALADNPEDLPGFLRRVGQACATATSEELRVARNFLASVEATGPTELVLSGIVELLDGYRDAREDLAQERTAELQLRDDFNGKVLKYLMQGSATPKAIAEELAPGKSGKPSNVSRVTNALNKLRDLDLVDPPARDGLDGRRRHYRLTPKAHALLERAIKRLPTEPSPPVPPPARPEPTGRAKDEPPAAPVFYSLESTPRAAPDSGTMATIAALYLSQKQ